jgi:class 3 adenylate cyclase
MRGSTTLSEAKLPYDVLFILNQFFHEMTKALVATNGHYSQFTGEGLMALYGLHVADPATGAADALRGAREMLTRLDQLNYRLRGDLREPLRIGIGIHHSEAIVGAMGPPSSQIITAIGDTVKTCARLESLTKEYQCVVIVSRSAAEAAGLKLEGHKLHQALVKGRMEPMQFYTLQTLARFANLERDRGYLFANARFSIKPRNPTSLEYCFITRRRVIYVPGYDPQGPQGYYALFGSQLKRACALWLAEFELGPLAIESADNASYRR